MLEELTARATALERAGEWQAADQLYGTIFRQAVLDRSLPTVVDALRKAARVRFLQGCAEEGAELALLSLEIASRNAMPSAAARALNLMALIQHSESDFEGASALYQVALDQAREIGDNELIGAVLQNLGVLANIRGDLREARVLYFESVASTVRSDDRTAAMAAYNNLGMVCADLQEWMEAEIYFTRGLEIAEQLGDSVMLARLHCNRAEPLVHAGELDRAIGSLETAEAMAEQSGDPRTLTEVARFRAVIARILMDFATAEEQLERAAGIAEGTGLELERGEIHEEMAHLRWAEGRPGAARMLLREARRVFTDLEARQDLARLARTEADWNAHASLGEIGTSPS